VRRETFAAPGPLRLELKVPAGEIEVDAVATGEAVVELETLRGDERVVEDARVELRGDELRVEVRDRSGSAAEVRLRVAVPDGSSLTAAVASADLTARGRLGDAELKAASGDLELEHVGGLRVKSASGDLQVDRVVGEARVQTASGDVALALVAGDAEIAAASGDVHVGDAGEALKVQSASGDQRIDTVTAGRVELTSASGDVRVGIRRGSRVFLDVRSASGDVDSELEVGDEPGDDDDPLVELKVTTMSGDVELVRAQ
jgi:Putative adhesin